jgi:hypothetical protein
MPSLRSSQILKHVDLIMERILLHDTIDLTNLKHTSKKRN